MITIIEYQPEWPQRYLEIAGRLKAAMDQHMIAIHHIGSTSIPGMAAKDIIDIQITVTEFSEEVLVPIRKYGFTQLEQVFKDHHPPGIVELKEDELLKVFFQLNRPAVNLHVRKSGKFNQRYALLCRDYLRSNPAAAKAYEQVKIHLARHVANDMTAYYNIKDPVFDIIMAGAWIWADQTQWSEPKSDL